MGVSGYLQRGGGAKGIKNINTEDGWGEGSVRSLVRVNGAKGVSAH